MKSFLLAALICCSLSVSYAQTWQWGNVAGSRFSTDLAGNAASDESRFLAVDPAGNSYAILTAGRRIYSGANSSLEDGRRFVLASWACDGRLRWMKTFGEGSLVFGMGVDSLGGIYMSGYMGISAGNHIDNDTIIPAAPAGVIKGNFIVKYDTSGHLQWLRMPDPNTINAQNNDNRPRLMRLNVSPNGELDILSYLSAGIHADGSYTVTTDGLYILRYNKNGSFTEGIKLPVTTPYVDGYPVLFGVEFGGGFIRDPHNGRYYIANNVSAPASYPALYVGNQVVRTNSIANIFMMSFDRHGTLKWLKQQADNDISSCSDLKVGVDGAIYLAGQMSSGSQWNGTTFTAPSSSVTQMDFVVKMDSLGNNVWNTTGYSPANETSPGVALSISNNNVLHVSGPAFNQFTWGSYHLSLPPSGLNNNSGTFLARLDPATGQCMGMDSLRIPVGKSVGPAFIAHDRNDNVFIAGLLGNPPEENGTLMIIGNTQLVAIGGNTDIFIAKYGKASCSPSTTTGIEDIMKTTEWHVYPNPADDVIHIGAARAGEYYELYNTIGAKILSGNITGTDSNLSVATLPVGIYYLMLTTRDRTGRKVFKVLKTGPDL